MEKVVNGGERGASAWPGLYLHLLFFINSSPCLSSLISEAPTSQASSPLLMAFGLSFICQSALGLWLLRESNFYGNNNHLLQPKQWC